MVIDVVIVNCFVTVIGNIGALIWKCTDNAISVWAIQNIVDAFDSVDVEYAAKIVATGTLNDDVNGDCRVDVFSWDGALDWIAVIVSVWEYQIFNYH